MPDDPTQVDVSAEDQQALLEALASARANAAHTPYDANITHGPTLIKAAAAVGCGAMLFLWCVTPAERPKPEKERPKQTRYVHKQTPSHTPEEAIKFVEEYLENNGISD